MRILLVRHGEAVPYDTTPVDERRWLTERGRAGVRAVAYALAEKGLRFTRVYTSPLVRAVQTAEILVQHVHPACDVPVLVHVPLSAEEGSPAQALAVLDSARPDDTVVLVTHMPKVSALAAQLSGGQRFSGFETGAACLITRQQGSAQVEFMIDPSRLD
ncbi:MAG: phosphohistidine phosphatase SixA [Polyangiales bacterium]|nr:phosphohistidine phosphatase SixA [Sandaracinaceae bacterium]